MPSAAALRGEVSVLCLEAWVHRVIQRKLETDEAFSRFTGKGNRGQISHTDMDAYRFFMLSRTLQYVYEKSTFYRELFDGHSVKPEDFRSLRDLTKFPFTRAGHIAEYPYRFLCTSQSEIARVHTFVTSGTTGPQKKIFWSRGDLERITDFMAAGIGTVARSEDVVHILLPNGRPHSQADLLCKGVKKLGATPIVGNFDADPEEQLKLIEDSHSTVVFGYTSRIFRLSKELQTKHNLAGKGVKCLFLAAEYLPAAMRRELQALWNCRVHTHYGLTEMGLGVAVECDAGDGYHFNEADLLLEVVDPRTGEPVDAGVEGELVFTTLTREAMPLIRYRTHDLSRVITEPCSCGATTLLKIDKVKKRLEAILYLDNGDQLYPALFDNVLFEIPDLLDYQVALTRRGNMDLLKFKIEMLCERSGISRRIRNKLLSIPTISENISAGRMLMPEVELVERGSLKSVNRAKKLIADRRASAALGQKPEANR